MKYLVLLLAVLLLIPAPVQAITYDSTLVLDNKDTTTWARISDGKLGTLNYNSSGATFNYSFSATGMEASTAYSLIYFANPYPGNNPGCLIGTGTSAADGTLVITGTPNLAMNLPTPPDSNMLVDHSGPPDNYVHAFGAKIWLVPSACYNATTKSISTWSPTRFLLETDLMTYTDTDLGGGSAVTTSATITEPAATIGLTVSPPTVAFGSVAIGSCSADNAVTLTNTGNVPIKVTAATSAGLNTDCMQIKPNSGVYVTANGWVSPTIAAGGNLIVYLKICPTPAYSGSPTGSINFLASFAP